MQSPVIPLLIDDPVVEYRGSNTGAIGLEPYDRLEYSHIGRLRGSLRPVESVIRPDGWPFSSATAPSATASSATALPDLGVFTNSPGLPTCVGQSIAEFENWDRSDSMTRLNVTTLRLGALDQRTADA